MRSPNGVHTDTEISSRTNPGGGARRCGTNTLTSTKKVFEDVLTERRYQDRQWGHGVDDTKNTPWMWTAYVCSYATEWMKDPFRFKREDTNEFYDRMIETAAIAAAACEKRPPTAAT